MYLLHRVTCYVRGRYRRVTVQPVCLVRTLYYIRWQTLSSRPLLPWSERTFQHGATAKNVRVRDHPDLAPHAGQHAYHAGQRLTDG